MSVVMISQHPAAFGDFGYGRRFTHWPESYPVAAIVIHVSTASMKSLDNQFADPKSHVSAHYGVARDGDVHQYVNEDDTAFHAGRVVNPTWPLIMKNGAYFGIDPNLFTIGIEHEGTATDIWTDAQYQASAGLILDICSRRKIPIDALHIVPHHAIRSDKSCPGMGDVGRLIATATRSIT